MKTRIFAVILILLLILPLGVNALSEAFTFTPKEDFIGAYKSENKKELANKLGLTEKETSELFSDKNLEYFAISDDRTSQLSISVYSNDLSVLTGDTSRLDDESLKKFAESLLESSEDTYEIQKQNGITYVVFNEDVENSKGKSYYSSQYITVSGGDFYHITFITSKPSAKEDIKDIVSTFKITKTQKQPISIVYILLLAVLIAAFIAVATVMLVGIIKRLKQKQLQEIKEKEQEYKPITKE